MYCILGGTNTAEGIRWAQDIVSFSDRAHVQKSIILLTNDESLTNSAAAAATSAKNEGIYIIVVGKRLHGVCLKKKLLKSAQICRSYPPSRGQRFLSMLLCSVRWVELVFFHISTHSVHPPQYGPSFMYLPSNLHRSYLQHHCRLFSLHGHTTKIISG